RWAVNVSLTMLAPLSANVAVSHGGVLVGVPPLKEVLRVYVTEPACAGAGPNIGASARAARPRIVRAAHLGIGDGDAITWNSSCPGNENGEKLKEPGIGTFAKEPGDSSTTAGDQLDPGR